MSAVVCAYHEMGCMGLRVLLRRGVDVAAVFTYEDDPAEERWFGSVAELAREAGVPTHTPEGLKDPRWADYIRSLEPDVLFSFYYRHLVGKRIREIPRRGCVNLHGSLLPKYRGRCPVNWQLIHGERVAGVTLHHMVARADAGDIIDQEAVEVGADDTAYDLYQKLLAAGERVLERRVDQILEGTAPRRPQDDSEATLFGGRRPEDGRIDWRRSAREIHDLVRAVAPPWPGAFAERPEGRVMVHRSRPREAPAEARGLRPGTVTVGEDGSVAVATGDGLLELREYEAPAGLELRSGLVLESAEEEAR